MSAEAWQYGSVAFSAILIAGIQAWTAYRTNRSITDASERAEDRATAAAVETAEVRTDLKLATAKTDVKLEDLKKVSKDTHTLVNSNMGIQLLLHLNTSKRLAKVTNDPDDIAAAEQAQKMYDEHMAKQAIVDARNQ